MRLLHSHTLELKEFIGTTMIPYAILSHTWGEGEVSFKEMQCREGVEKPGYNKIKRCCEVAAADGFEYVWIDTCCIDKTSSSELSEAINSMYQWYKRAETCYVHLVDVSSNAEPRTLTSVFAESRWFTRGWTLQELIAPSNVIFFDTHWQDIGTKHSLLASISEITGIHVSALSGAKLEDFSIAQRMSWASKRKTTREEDIAYCLMGIFDINMPMLYGEGERAFLRLQEEIMKRSDDHSIFAWKPPSWAFGQCGFLAQSPLAFAHAATIIRSTHTTESPPFAITNKGIHLQLPLKSLDTSRMVSSSLFLAVLDCQEIGLPDDLLCIWVREVSRGIFGMECIDDNAASLATMKHKERDKLPIVSIFAVEYKAAYHSLSKAPYTKLLLIDKTWIEENGVYLLDSYPSYLISTSGITLDAEDYPPDGFLVGVLRFTCSDNSGDGFFVTLWMNGNMLAASVHILHPEETLDDIVDSFSKRPPTEESRELASDRINWQHPVKWWCISVVIKRQIICGKRRIVVIID